MTVHYEYTALTDLLMTHSWALCTAVHERMAHVPLLPRDCQDGVTNVVGVRVSAIQECPVADIATSMHPSICAAVTKLGSCAFA